MKTVPVSECDYLDEDPPLRGQNYVCLSFISPNDIIKRKEVFYFENFVKHFSNEMQVFFGDLLKKYPNEEGIIKTIGDRYNYIFNENKMTSEYDYFISQNDEKLNKEFMEKNDFQTNVRGVKIRGVFDTMKEAEIRTEVLKKKDPNFHIYIGTVGCWLPWSPIHDHVDRQEYAEEELNTLMKAYKENESKKEEYFETRKEDLKKIRASIENVIERPPAVELVNEDEPKKSKEPLPKQEEVTFEEVEASKEKVKN